ncbi:FAD-dependent oxidoreductase [Knoellia sp. CPCC 206453]|uniref:FAD-dependent oxidoreductase n=1 Tax=Knoellia pratensis TaxID=3404796 RepID=UPI003612CEFE
MPYVVTQSCCADASCVVACPVNAIHPTPGEPGFAEAEMLFVDPATCVDCGACATACPVDAVLPHSKLAPNQLPFIELNALHYKQNPYADRTAMEVIPAQRDVAVDDLRVAVVGAGPAGLYAADELLKLPGVRVDVFDRLPVPHGLARYGVAPDHQHTKKIMDLFSSMEQEKGFRYRLNVTVGSDVSHEQLRTAYHAVVYAVGAASDRRLGLEGEDLSGSGSATEFVAWYNGHPDQAGVSYPLDSERAVVIGNGNVALDVARILTSDPEVLAGTDIADGALEALRDSAIREVIVLGRRGPAEAAFTLPELVGLAGIEGIDVVVEGEVDPLASSVLGELAGRPRREGLPRVVLRFNTAPVRLIGGDRVEGLEIATTEVVDGRAVPTGHTEIITTGLVLRAIGYRATPVKDLPFDDDRAVVPHDGGRVAPGVYVTGWIKRGPTGFLGSNKTCAQQTVVALLDDADAGLLAPPTGTLPRLPGEVSTEGWRAIDRAERTAGALAGRPRIKLVDREAMIDATREPQRARRIQRSRVVARAV